MSALIPFVISMITGFTSANLPAFDRTEYLPPDGTATMLDQHYVKDLQSPELFATLETFMGNHFDQIVHISGHYAQESDMHYYAIYGFKNNEKKADFLTVAKALFDREAYYQFAFQLSAKKPCRRGNGYAASLACPDTNCKKQKNECVGMICPPAECG